MQESSLLVLPLGNNLEEFLYANTHADFNVKSNVCY